MKRKVFYWAPRVLAIIFVIFISLFALDVFGEGYGFFETIIALFMHLIPTFVLIVLLIIAWEKKKLSRRYCFCCNCNCFYNIF